MFVFLLSVIALLSCFLYFKLMVCFDFQIELFTNSSTYFHDSDLQLGGNFNLKNCHLRVRQMSNRIKFFVSCFIRLTQLQMG